VVLYLTAEVHPNKHLGAAGDDPGRVHGQAAFLYFDLEMPDPRPPLMPVKPVGGQVGPDEIHEPADLAGNGPEGPLRHARPDDAKPYVRRRG
jgi:hypothetical protein